MTCYIFSKSGDHGVSAWSDWRHNGPLHWILHPQWDRDRLLCSQVLFLIESKRGLKDDIIIKKQQKRTTILKFTFFALKSFFNLFSLSQTVRSFFIVQKWYGRNIFQ